MNKHFSDSACELDGVAGRHSCLHMPLNSKSVSVNIMNRGLHTFSRWYCTFANILDTRALYLALSLFLFGLHCSSLVCKNDISLSARSDYLTCSLSMSSDRSVCSIWKPRLWCWLACYGCRPYLEQMWIYLAQNVSLRYNRFLSIILWYLLIDSISFAA